MIHHQKGHLVGDCVLSTRHCFVVSECVHNDVDKASLARMCQWQSLVGEKVACHIDIVLNGVGSYCSARDGFPLDEQDIIAGKEIVLLCRVGEVYTWVMDVGAVAEGKKVFLSGQVSFCQLGSL